MTDLKATAAESDPVEPVVSEELIVDSKGYHTSSVMICRNSGCGFADGRYCTATGTECFGYMKAT